jgi:prepilin-type N-terminal cleavage/methylation domain-containing protein
VYWNKKGFTLIELLVVIVLIGVTSLVAIPNVREFIINREYKNDVYKISTIINSLQSDLQSKKTDIQSTLPYELGSVLISGDVTKTTAPSGIQISIGKADSQRFQTFRPSICDINSSSNQNFWNTIERYNSTLDRSNPSSANDTFINLLYSPGTNWACFTIKMDENRNWFDEYSGGVRGICHRSKIDNGARCGPSTTNDPYYGISVNKFGRATIHRYNYATSTWKEVQN